MAHDRQDGGVIAALQRPEVLLDFTLADWDLFVRLARASGLLARFGIALRDRGMLLRIPEAPRRHLEAEAIIAEKHGRDVRWEVRAIRHALTALGTPVILLKGAAYVLADLPPNQGRLFQDVDILVRRPQIERVEELLRAAGWEVGEISAYDDGYYRRRMHQIPPLTHRGRGTTIDVHHTIVPMTARVDLASEALFEHSVPAGDDPLLRVLAPPDMVLHSATHLFNEGEFQRGLRDLDDLNQLLRHFGRDEAFWASLLERARELDLERPLYYALRYVERVLGTPIPAEVVTAAGRLGPGALGRRLMDELFLRALRPPHPKCRDALSGVALWLLYVRAHHLRMPPHLLVPHLVRKAIQRRMPTPEKTEEGIVP